MSSKGNKVLSVKKSRQLVLEGPSFPPVLTCLSQGPIGIALSSSLSSVLCLVFRRRQMTQWKVLGPLGHHYQTNLNLALSSSYCCHLMISFPIENKSMEI